MLLPYVVYKHLPTMPRLASVERSVVHQKGLAPARGRPEILPPIMSCPGRAKHHARQANNPTKRNSRMGRHQYASRLGPQPGCASNSEGGERNAGTGGYTKPPRHLAISEI